MKTKRTNDVNAPIYELVCCFVGWWGRSVTAVALLKASPSLLKATRPQQYLTLSHP